MPRLTANQAGILSEMQLRLRAAAQQKLDPRTNSLMSAMAVAGLISDVARQAESRGYSGDAKRLRKAAEYLQAQFLAGKPWQSIATYAAGMISAILIKSGFRQLDHGWMDIQNVPGPSSWDIRAAAGRPEAQSSGALPGATYASTGTRTKLPGTTGPVLVPPPPGPPQVNTENDMDPLTGVDDPLAENIRYSTSGDDRNWVQRQIDRAAGAYNWVDDNIIDLPGAGPGAGSGPGAPQYPTGPQFPTGTPTPPVQSGPQSGYPEDPSWWYAQGQALRNAFTGGNGNGGDGTNLPLPFPLPQLGGLYDYAFGGNGQMPDVGSLMLPAVTAPAATARLKAPKGYVIVTIQPNDPLYASAAQAGGVQQPDGSIKVAMDKDKARKRKYWKPRPKPWLTAADRRVLTKANRVEKKVAKAYLKAGIGPKDIKEAKNC